MAGKGLSNTKTVLRSLIISSPNGITIQQLMKDYIEQEGSEIPYAALGFARLDLFLLSLNDTCYVRTEGYLTKVYAIQSAASNHINKMVQEQNKPKKSRKSSNYANHHQSSRNYGNQNQSSRNYGSQYNMNKIEPWSSESYCPSNWSSYQPVQKPNSANMKSTGYIPAGSKFNSDQSSKESVRFDRSPRGSPSTSHQEHETSPDHLRLNQSKAQNASSSQPIAQVQEMTNSFQDMNTKKSEYFIKNTSRCTEAIPFLSDDDEVFRVGLPEKVAKLGTHIAPSTIPSNIRKGSTLDIYVSEINNPFRFWFHIQKDQHKLDQLMDDLGNYYKSCLHGELNLPPTQTSAGQLCAAFVLGMWHRAEIVHPINGNDKVKLYCIDYGTIISLQLCNLKFLLNEFCVLPSQAYRGCLSQIQPIGPRWKLDSSFHFFSLVPDAMINALVEDIDYEEQVLRLLLVNKNGEHDLTINQALVDKGIAKQMLPSDGPNGSTKRHYCERYPTFAMLETAIYPSLTAIEEMLKKGIDFEAMLDENIIPELDISCGNLELGDQIGSSCFVGSQPILYELSSDNHIQNDAFSESFSDISSESFKSIASMQQSSYHAPQPNPPIQTAAIIKPTAAGPALTLDSLVSTSRDTISLPRNLHSPAGLHSEELQDEICVTDSNNSYQVLEFDEQMGIQLDTLSTQNDGQSESSPKEIPSVSLESKESMHLSLQAARQVKPRINVRKLKMADWGKTAATEPAPTANSSAIQPQNSSGPLKKKMETSLDVNIIPQLNTSCPNMKFDERLVNSSLIQLDLSSDNHIQAEMSTSDLLIGFDSPPQATSSPVPKTENTKSEQTNSQRTDIVNTDSPQLTTISDLSVEQPSFSRWCPNHTFVTLRQPIY